MTSEERLQLILLRLKQLNSSFKAVKAELEEVMVENKQLKNENHALKKTNFDLEKRIDIANIANQILEGTGKEEVRKKIDKYIREVDGIISTLKKIK